MLPIVPDMKHMQLVMKKTLSTKFEGAKGGVSVCSIEWDVEIAVKFVDGMSVELNAAMSVTFMAVILISVEFIVVIQLSTQITVVKSA